MITKLDAERKLLLPREWAVEFGAKQEVELVRCADCVLIKPLSRNALQTALKRKVAMNQHTQLDLSDLDMDALGW